MRDVTRTGARENARCDLRQSLVACARDMWRGKRRSGLTLIELVVASSLAAVLLLTIVGLLRMVSRERSTTRQDARPTTRLLAEQVRRDMLNARFIRIGQNETRLVGYMGQDRATRRATLRRVEVVYRIVAQDRHPVLVRRETPLDGIQRRPAVDVLWIDAASLEVTSLESEDESEDELAADATFPGMKALDGQLVVLVRAADGTVIMEETILHHAYY